MSTLCIFAQVLRTKSNTIVQKNRLHLVKAQNEYYNINISYAGEKLCCLQQ